MSKIDETQAVSQESLDQEILGQAEPSNFSAKFEGFDEPTPQPEVVEEPTNETENEVAEEAPEVVEDNIDEGGVEAIPEDADAGAEQEEVQPEGEGEVEIEEITIDDDPEPVAEEPAAPAIDPADIPEWVQKLMDFNKDTGGGLEEYLNYTKDYDALDNTAILKEYYKSTKPGYSDSDIDLLIEHKFGTEEPKEGEEMSREDKLKQLALKDEVLIAKEFLNGNKEKYYADLKSGVQGAPEQYKEAVQFYDDYQKNVEAQKVVRDTFIADSNTLFNEEFQGFQFDAGGKQYRLKVGNPQKVMESQLDINEVLNGFADENGNISNVAEYHRAVWAAKNADKLFNAGIEAGKALALKERAQATKNPSYANEGPSQTPKPTQGFRFLGNDDF